jgi:hypothetical protein
MRVPRRRRRPLQVSALTSIQVRAHASSLAQMVSGAKVHDLKGFLRVGPGRWISGPYRQSEISHAKPYYI